MGRFEDEINTVVDKEVSRQVSGALHKFNQSKNTAKKESQKAQSEIAELRRKSNADNDKISTLEQRLRVSDHSLTKANNDLRAWKAESKE